MEEPNLLLLDIETFPILGESWEAYEQNLLRVLRPVTICAFTAKWLDGTCITKILPDYKGYKPITDSTLLEVDDSKITKDIWDLLDKANIVVAHNGDRFDIKKINSRFLVHGFSPPSPYKTVDTLKIAHSTFGFDQNTLKFLASTLGVGDKIEAGGYPLWQGCMYGDKKAWAKMKKYSKQDVLSLEGVYKEFRPWSKTHPIMGMYEEGEVCPKCSSRSLQNRGWAVTRVARYQRVQCLNCGAWGRRTENIQELKPIVNI